jgi:hypothetical protein
MSVRKISIHCNHNQIQRISFTEAYQLIGIAEKMKLEILSIEGLFEFWNYVNILLVQGAIK